MTITEAEFVTESEISQKKIAHYECCIDPNTVLCGRDGTNMKPVNDDDPVCVTCEHNDQMNVCPIYGMCTLGPHLRQN